MVGPRGGKEDRCSRQGDLTRLQRSDNRMLSLRTSQVLVSEKKAGDAVLPARTCGGRWRTGCWPFLSLTNHPARTRTCAVWRPPPRAARWRGSGCAGSRVTISQPWLWAARSQSSSGASCAKRWWCATKGILAASSATPSLLLQAQRSMNSVKPEMLPSQSPQAFRQQAGAQSARLRQCRPPRRGSLRPFRQTNPPPESGR